MALAQQSADPPAALRANVTSKGGTTARALDVLNAAQVNAHFIAAVKAAAARARELGDEIAADIASAVTMLNTALAYLIDVFFGLFTYALLLRLVMQVMRAPFRNPLGQAVMALTDWIVKPLRKVLPGLGGIDWASVVAAYLFQFAWLIALFFAFGSGFAFFGPGLPFLAIGAVIALLKALLWLTIIVVLAQAILSWVAPDGPLAGVLNALTFPSAAARAPAGAADRRNARPVAADRHRGCAADPDHDRAVARRHDDETIHLGLRCNRRARD